MLETLLMAVINLTGGRLAEVFFGIDYEGHARICTTRHIYVSGMSDLDLQRPPHLDVEIRAWSKGGHASTILRFSAKHLREDMTMEKGRSWKPLVLEPSGVPVDLEFILEPIPKGAAVPYSVGDKVPFELHMSRGWVKKIEVTVEPPQP